MGKKCYEQMPVIPEQFKIDAYAENGEITLFPTILGHTKHVLEFILPIYVVSSVDARGIGDKVIEVASHIDLVNRGERSLEVVESDAAITRTLGHSSWAKVKKSMNLVSLTKDIDSDIIFFFPMHPYGRGFSYHVVDESYIKNASIENTTDIGQALLDALEAF